MRAIASELTSFRRSSPLGLVESPHRFDSQPPCRQFPMLLLYSLMSVRSSLNSYKRVFPISKGCRTGGFVFLVFSVLVGLDGGYWYWVDPYPGMREISAVFSFSFCLMMTSVGVWFLLAYWRESLTVWNSKVIQRGVIFHREIDLPNVRNAGWKLGRYGSLTLSDSVQTLTINFGKYEKAERLWLIRFFRGRLPESIQDGWELFCYKVAVPERDGGLEKVSIPTAEQTIISRKRWDWYFIPPILLLAVFGVVMFWKTQRLGVLASPLLLVPLWLYLRCVTPKRGLIAKRIGSDSDETWFVVFLLLSSGVFIVGSAAFKQLNLPQPQEGIVAAVALVLYFAVLAWQVSRMDRAKRQRYLKRNQESINKAVQQWDDGERTSGKANEAGSTDNRAG